MLMKARNRSRALAHVPYWRDDDATWARGKRGARSKRAERRRVRHAENRQWRADLAEII